MSNRKPDPKEQLVQRIRDLRKLEHNRKCFDCSEKAPTYVCLTFNTFICMTCSGIHRQFNRKVKSITASEFTEEEVQALEQGGNEAAAKQWLHSWKPSDFAEPSASDATKIKEFMVRKYDQKRWVKTEVPKPKKKSASSRKVTSTAPEAEKQEEQEEKPQKPDLSNLSSIIGFDEENPAPDPDTSVSKGSKKSTEDVSKRKQSEENSKRRSSEEVSKRKSGEETHKTRERKASNKAESKKSAKTGKRGSGVENLLDIDSLLSSNGTAFPEDHPKSEEEPWGFEAENKAAAAAKDADDWGKFIGQPAATAQPIPAARGFAPAPVPVMDPGFTHFQPAPIIPSFAVSPQGPLTGASTIPSPAVSTTTGTSKVSTPSASEASPALSKKDDPFAVLMSGSDDVPVHYSLDESNKGRTNRSSVEHAPVPTAATVPVPAAAGQPIPGMYGPAFYNAPSAYYPGPPTYVYYPGYPPAPAGVPPAGYPYYTPYGYPPGAPPPSQ